MNVKLFSECWNSYLPTSEKILATSRPESNKRKVEREQLKIPAKFGGARWADIVNLVPPLQAIWAGNK